MKLKKTEGHLRARLRTSSCQSSLQLSLLAFLVQNYLLARLRTSSRQSSLLLSLFALLVQNYLRARLRTSCRQSSLLLNLLALLVQNYLRARLRTSCRQSTSCAAASSARCSSSSSCQYLFFCTSKASKVSTVHVARRLLLRALQILRQCLQSWTSTKKRGIIPTPAVSPLPVKRFLCYQ